MKSFKGKHFPSREGKQKVDRSSHMCEWIRRDKAEEELTREIMEFWKVSSLQDKCQPDPKCAFQLVGTNGNVTWNQNGNTRKIHFHLGSRSNAGKKRGGGWGEHHENRRKRESESLFPNFFYFAPRLWFLKLLRQPPLTAYNQTVN